MKALLLLAALLFGIGTFPVIAEPTPNKLIHSDSFLKAATAVGELRKTRRVTEEQFIALAKQPGTIVLDARSAEKYRLRHIKGAVNLSLPDFTEETLTAVIPSKSATVLIYCNNNFLGDSLALPTKRPGRHSTSLHLPRCMIMVTPTCTNWVR
ncbi:MAG: rhodanese-like domain-containing protein [Deltaproteobacteria bacterium]|nr:rhodanese-like domain-containing protein [Deltaproteobacteria bacterium]